ncbi:MAG: GNAT family N-acetyltransferase [Gammaproteobacteria bacterium]|nr:GNAT family N-acetyltransferase [Gammaproteobacteria bacterium]
MIQIEIANSIEQLTAIEKLAAKIWEEHYTPIIGPEQVQYMLSNFQTISAMQEQIARENYRYYSILTASQLIGYLSFKQNEQTLFLSKLYIDKACRGKGFAHNALEFISDWGVKHHCNVIELTVNKYNSSSIAAYKKLGFTVTDEAVFDIGAGYVMDDYIMQRPITLIA